MASPNPDDLLLLIRCPSCGQRFKVGEDLRDRTVECGGCESRFRINEEVIVRGRKVYPGERKTSELSRFQRVPLPGGEKIMGIQPVLYGTQPDPAVMEPVSPQRIMAGAAGVIGMVITALLLMFGGGPGHLLDGMDLTARLMIAGFASLIGLLLLIYASPKARMKSGTVGVLFAAGVVALPFFFKQGMPVVQQPGVTATMPLNDEAPVVSQSTEEVQLQALRDRIGSGPLDLEVKRLTALKSDKHAIGLWLRGMTEGNRYRVMDYIVRVTGAGTTSHFYPRDKGDFLFVVTGITTSMHDLAELTTVFGDVAKLYPELSIIEIRVRNESFVEGPIDRLTNKGDPQFYELNKRELESIDLERVKRAVERLAGAEPKIYRSDISRRLQALLGQPGIDFKDDVCAALLIWSEQPGVAGRAAVAEAEKLAKAEKPVPASLVEVAVKEKDPGIVPLLDRLWFKNPMGWESLYGDMGSLAEPAILKRFPETEGLIRYSAARMLGRIGGAASLPVLEQASAAADSELKVILEQARKAILGRSSR